MIKIIRAAEPAVKEIINKKYTDEAIYEQRVKAILADVSSRGDAAVLEYTARFDGAELTQETLRVSEEEIAQAYAQVDPEVLASLRVAKERIEAFHQKQLTKSWMEPDSDGSVLGQLVLPMERVGVYVPGGTASYPSSVLMNALPAKVAGVKEIVMCAPPTTGGNINPYSIVAAKEAGVTEIYKVGGAQAVAALAYGTESIAKVDLITGPGNIYVTLAKKEVFGKVQIDMLAGPSEILVVADETANPTYVAADLLSQAEHDTLASSILVTTSMELAQEVQAEVTRQVGYLSRKEIMTASLGDYSAILVAESMEEAISLANAYAPEHLELVVANPFEILGKIKNAGAVFLGSYSPEPVGDYLAGPNHVLPTGGTARFYSPLNVDTFMKKTSVIAFSQATLQRYGQDIIRLAEVEGLDAHANAVKVRMV